MDSEMVNYLDATYLILPFSFPMAWGCSSPSSDSSAGCSWQLMAVPLFTGGTNSRRAALGCFFAHLGRTPGRRPPPRRPDPLDGSIRPGETPLVRGSHPSLKVGHILQVRYHGRKACVLEHLLRPLVQHLTATEASRSRRDQTPGEKDSDSGGVARLQKQLHSSSLSRS